jgi:Tol biopolymer transport system component
MEYSTFSRPQLIRHFLIGLSGSMIVVAALFYISANPGQGVQPDKIVTALSQSSIWLFLLYVTTGLIGVWFRAVRYRILIVASGEDAERIPGMKKMVFITAVRGMVVDLLPARLGELIYVALLKKFAGTSIPAGLSSLLFAMILDIAVLAPVTILLILFIGFPNTGPLKVAIVALLIVIGFYVGIRYILPRIIAFLNRITPRERSIVGKLVAVINQLNDAIQATITAGVFGRVFGITIVVRALKYIGLLILFKSVAAGSFPTLEALSSLKILAAMLASEMTAALPIPTLMSFGAWELGGVTFMALFGAPPQESLISLIAIHIQSQAVDYGIGLTALFLLFANESSKPRYRTGKLQVPVFAAGFAVIALISAVASWVWLDTQSGKTSAITESGAIPIEQRPAWMQDLNGFIVWTSNRSGNHDIMIMDLPGLYIRKLTDDPHTESHPRISPDGQRIAFSRSIEKFQSWRDQRPWNIWVKDIITGKEQKIANSGTAPGWSEDGNKVYFQRSIGEIWSYDFTTGKESQLLKRNTDNLPDTELLWPSIDAAGRLAVSFKDNGRPTNIILEDGKEVVVVSRGCMLTWSPKNDFAMFVSSKDGGKQSNQFNRYDPETGSITKWLDLPGELSHEYFPRLDRSQQYLVFAASDGAHEPDIEDYEIHIWKTDTDNAEAQRITFDRGNDSWPDIYLRPGT